MSKEYPEVEQKKIEALMIEIKPTLKELNDIDIDMSSMPAPTSEMLRKWAREAVGKGNYIRKKQAKIAAAVKNEKAACYSELKLAATTSGEKTTENQLNAETDAYVSLLRTTRDVLGAYVLSADNIVSVCRMHLNQQETGNTVQL